MTVLLFQAGLESIRSGSGEREAIILERDRNELLLAFEVLSFGRDRRSISDYFLFIRIVELVAWLFNKTY